MLYPMKSKYKIRLGSRFYGVNDILNTFYWLAL